MTTIQITVTPDEGLGLSPVTKTVPLEASDYQAMIEAYVSEKGYYADKFTALGEDGSPVFTAPSHEEFVTALLKGLFEGVRNNVVSWVQAQKIASIATTAPEITVE